MPFTELVKTSQFNSKNDVPLVQLLESYMWLVFGDVLLDIYNMLLTIAIYVHNFIKGEIGKLVIG